MQRSEREERERQEQEDRAFSARHRQSGKLVRPPAPTTIDLLKEGFPFEPGGWYICVEPITPAEVSEHGIILAEITKTAEGYQATVGRVLKCGPSAFEGKTTSGIELKNYLPGISCAKDLIGTYQVYQQHTGQPLTLRKTGQRIIVMKLTDLLGGVADPQAWKFYV
jgi:hypothetical protein